MEITLLELFNIKRDIILESNSDLKKYITSEEKYNDFIRKIYSIMYFDINFLYIDNYASKVLDVLGEYKAYYKANDKNIENAIITNINIILNNKSKKETEEKYYNNQNALRGNIFEKRSEIKNAMIYDSVALKELDDNIQYIDIKYFLSTISYVLNMSPEYIYNDESIKEKINSILSSVKKINIKKDNRLLKNLKRKLR